MSSYKRSGGIFSVSRVRVRVALGLGWTFCENFGRVQEDRKEWQKLLRAGSHAPASQQIA